MDHNQTVDWTTYDRISPTTLHLEGKGDVPFEGLVIGRRKFLGIFDYIGMPFLVVLLISLFPFYANVWVKKIQPDWLAWTVFWGLIVLGPIIAILVFFYIYGAKKENDKEGTANVYLNLETRQVGIRDWKGKCAIIPLDQITKPAIFRLFSLQVGPLSFKLYARLIFFWNDGGKKRITIVHFMDDPESTAHLLMEILHERKD